MQKLENGDMRYTPFEPLTSEFGEDNGAVVGASKINPTVPSDAFSIAKEILRHCIPVTFGSLVLPLVQVADSLLVINILSARGYSRADATMSYGLLTGTVMTLINLPVVIIYALSVALLPRVAKLYNNQNKAGREASFSLKTGMALGIIATLFFLFNAPTIVEVLYSGGLKDAQKELCVSLLRISAVSVFYISVIQSTTSALQGLGKAKIPAFNLAIGGAIKVFVTAVTLFCLGIYGSVIGTSCCYAFTAIADLFCLKKKLPLPCAKKSVFAMIIAVLAFVVSTLLSKWAFAPTGEIMSLLLSSAVGFIAFVAPLFAFGWFDEWESKRILPFLKKKR